MQKIMVCGSSPASGKDSFGDYLVSKGYVKTSFARSIYKIADELFQMKGKDRKLLQDIGEKMREIDPMVWVNDTLRHIEKMKPLLEIAGVKGVIISDLRMPHEYDACTKEGFVPVRITCNRETAIKRMIERDGYVDESLLDNYVETGVNGIPMYEIDNSGTLEDFHKKIDEFLLTLE